jgi:hypothetical protein
MSNLCIHLTAFSLLRRLHAASLPPHRRRMRNTAHCAWQRSAPLGTGGSLARFCRASWTKPTTARAMKLFAHFSEKPDSCPARTHRSAGEPHATTRVGGRGAWPPRGRRVAAA